MINDRISVTTLYNRDEIVQEVILGERVILRKVLDLQNEQVRQALTALGWKPPKEGS